VSPPRHDEALLQQIPVSARIPSTADRCAALRLWLGPCS